MSKIFLTILIVLTLVSQAVFAQNSNAEISGKRYKRIVVRNAIVVNGSGRPASGPFDIVIENDLISEIVGLDPVAVKDGNGKASGKRRCRN